MTTALLPAIATPDGLPLWPVTAICTCAVHCANHCEPQHCSGWCQCSCHAQHYAELRRDQQSSTTCKSCGGTILPMAIGGMKRGSCHCEHNR